LLSALRLLVPIVLLVSSALGQVTGRHGMVVSADSLASAVGVEVLRSGGNAVDAAVAVGFTLAVTFPEAGNIGGGGYMVIYRPGKSPVMIDFREKAPARSSKDMYLDSLGRPVPDRSLLGHLSAGVPGSVAGLLHALEKYGTKDREEILRHPIEIARNGFRVNHNLATQLRESLQALTRFTPSLKTFTRNGTPYSEGDTLRLSDLAHTLQAIADNGVAGFYEGPVAAMIASEMSRGGGLITASDLSSYSPAELAPVTGSYRGYTIISASPSSSGGVILLEILNILERFDLRRRGHNSPQSIHLFAAAAQRAYADRAEYLGDPEFVKIPTDVLVSKTYAAQRSASIDSLQRTPSSTIKAGGGVVKEGDHTTHYCVTDGDGNVVSVTVTLNELFGSKVVVDGAGFLLNDEMDDFVTAPGVPNLYGLTGGDANSIAPGKRMLSMMSPTIVLKDDKPLLALGARGGSRIATTVAQVISNVIDFRMGIQEAVDAPRVHHQWVPDVLCYEGGISSEAVEGLRALGYDCQQAGSAKVEALMIDPATMAIYGAPDPREGGVAIGY